MNLLALFFAFFLIFSFVTFIIDSIKLTPSSFFIISLVSFICTIICIPFSTPSKEITSELHSYIVTKIHVCDSNMNCKYTAKYVYNTGDNLTGDKGLNGEAKLPYTGETLEFFYYK